MTVFITDTTLRDAHQSLIATRMRTRDMLPVAENLDKAGFFSLEVWGGATFDASVRYLNEDPWERLRLLREKVRQGRLQMLLRGQNLVGYRHYADDVVEEFIRLSVKNGIDVFRIFDALNDIRNMQLCINVAKHYKAHVQGTICYTTSPVHTIEGFAQMAGDLERLGCDSVCIKDMAGLISPTDASALVKAIKAKIKIPVDLHSHCSSGMAPMSYYAAAEAGVDILDTAFSAFAWGTSQPPTESVAAALKDTSCATGLDLEMLYEIGEQFSAIAEKYKPLLTSEATRANINVLLHQVPGGMLSNLVSQLKEQNAIDKLGAVLAEVPRVRADMGYPPLVTPTSQLVGIQAVLNVLAGERYKRTTQEVKDYILGYYGRPPAPINEEIRALIVGSTPAIGVRPADLLPPELEKLKADGKKMGILHKEEDLLTYALNPPVGAKFLRGEIREESLTPAVKAAPVSAPALPSEFSVDVDGEVFSVKISTVVGRPIEVEKKAPKAKEAAEGAMLSPISGMILSLKVKVGDKVNEGDLVAIVEAMKMRNELRATSSGTITEIMAFEGEVISSGDAIVVIRPE